jgi:hypothetical protein
MALDVRQSRGVGGAGEQEQQAAEEVAGLDAERVGDQATEGEEGEPPGLSDHVESGKDSSPTQAEAPD